MQNVTIVRSNKLLNASNGRSCAHCGADDGTIVRAHIQGMRASAYGKGKGIKPSDLASADLCHECHAYFDQYQHVHVPWLSEQFLHAILITLHRDIEQGVIHIG